jgi:hypothetical protein
MVVERLAKALLSEKTPVDCGSPLFPKDMRGNPAFEVFRTAF